MSEPVNDVLAVLRAARDSVPAEQLLAYCAAMADVVELIEADNEYDAARHNVWIVSQSDDYAFTNGNAQRAKGRLDAAIARRAAALARVQGGAA